MSIQERDRSFPVARSFHWCIVMASFNFSSLSFDFDIFGDKDQEDQIPELLKTARLSYKPVVFDNALDMAADIDISQDYFALVSGSFVFGDLLEALCWIDNIDIERLYITTLGMSEDNVDSLVNMVDFLGVPEINLIVSKYFASVERNETIPYMIHEFAGRNINVAVLASHTKIALFECRNGKSFLLSGSANLSSSANLEAFTMTHCQETIRFCKNIFDGIMNKWTVIKGSTRETVFKNNNGNLSKEAMKAVQTFITK